MQVIACESSIKMSNLNSAFIKVYKKNDAKLKGNENTTSFSLDGLQTSISTNNTDSVSYFRVDSNHESQSGLRPWLTSISTVDVEGYVAASMAELPARDSDRQAVDTIAMPAVRSRGVAPEQRQEAVVESETLQGTRYRFDAGSNRQASQPPVVSQPPAKIEPESQVEVKPESEVEEPISESNLPFHAVWEVDSFQWPKLVDDLFRQDTALSSEIGRHLRQANRRGLKILAVTSAGASHGRSTVACCLAKAAARMGLRIALVDGDLHHPQLADRLNLDAVNDWQGTIVEQLPLEEAAIHSIEDRITLLPLQMRPQGAPLAPDHVKVQGVLRRLAASFDLVIIDSQHLGHPTGRLMGCGIDSPIDAAILVVDSNYQSEDGIEDSLRALARIGINSVGIVENFR